MADTNYTVTIGDISKQVQTASRLVVDTDSFWIQTAGDANGNPQTVMIPAEFVRAYLTAFLTGQYRYSDKGFEVSTDGGKTWNLAIPFDDMPYKFVNVTQDEYDSLVASGKTDAKTYYCVFEE